MTKIHSKNASPLDHQGALKAIEYARRALRNGDRLAVRRWAEQAALLDPFLEDPWLYLAAIASPRASLAYLHKALEINPTSQRAQKGIAWALGRLETGYLKFDQQDTTLETSITSLSPAATNPEIENSYSTEISSEEDGDQDLIRYPLSSEVFRISSDRQKTRKQRPITPFLIWYAFGTIFIAIAFLTAALSPFFSQLWSDLSSNLDPIIKNTSELLWEIPAAIGLKSAAATPTQQIPIEAAYELPSSQ